MTKMNRLIAGARELGITLSDEQLLQFRKYQDLLLDWNQRMNLTGVRDPELIQQRHFLDSLTCSLVTGDLNSQSLIDIGSGAGFPGLPLKILFPDLKLSLLESIGKKTTFLQVVVDELELTDVQIIVERAETLGQNGSHREQYDWALARAVARLEILVEYLLPFVKIGGHALAQKGRHAAEEMHDAEIGISMLGGGSPRIFPFQFPGQEEPSNLVLIYKIKQTPDKYPRRTGVPGKRPL